MDLHVVMQELEYLAFVSYMPVGHVNVHLGHGHWTLKWWCAALLLQLTIWVTNHAVSSCRIKCRVFLNNFIEHYELSA